MLYLVQYDLNAQKDYASLIDEIKRSPNWAHLLKSTWGIESNEDPQTLFNRLYATMDRDDDLLVTQLKAGFGWWAKLPPKLIDWLRDAASRA